MSLYKYLVDNNYYNLHVCYAQFEAQEKGDLNLSEGDVIIAVNQVNEHWMQGQICYDSRSKCWSTEREFGNFPVNHCWSLDQEQVKLFCQERLRNYAEEQHQEAVTLAPPFISNLIPSIAPPIPANPTTSVPSQSLSSQSSHSSSQHSSGQQQQFKEIDFHYQSDQAPPIYDSHSQSQSPPPKPSQPPRQSIQQTVDLAVVQHTGRQSSLLTCRQQDKLKGWLNLVKKKTARISTRITASLGLISLTRDEEFERHHVAFKHIEKTIRAFIKNLSTFVEHFENFLLSLQTTSDHLADFYRDKSHQKELDELRKKNRALAGEHFHAFKRTVDRQVIHVANQLLQKFAGPHQLISKRSAKLLDYDTKTKEMESSRDSEKIRDQYVIAKEVYERINRQLIEDLPKFNQLALDIFKECILVLLDSRRNLILSYTTQTASLLDTPLMMTYTASSILMSCQDDVNMRNSEVDHRNEGETSGLESRQNSANDEYASRPQSRASKLSSDFDQMAIASREISSTPLSQVSESKIQPIKFDEPDGGLGTSDGVEVLDGRHGETESPDEEPVRRDPPKEKRKKKKVQIYVASWPFIATGPNQLTITCKQPLKLVKGCDECGNSDWSLVQDKKGQLGYVPSSYIKRKE